MELTIFDYILLGAMLFIVGVGLFRGLSGELGSLAGFAAAALAGFLLFDAAKTVATSVGFGLQSPGMLTAAAGVVDFVFALIAYGIARWIVAKFVSFLLPQPTDAILGGLGGVFKCVVLLGLLAGVGFVPPGEYASGFCATNSAIVLKVAGLADSLLRD